MRIRKPTQFWTTIFLAAVALTALGVVRQCRNKPIPVGVISAVAGAVIVGSSEFNAGDMYLEEHPESPVRMVAVDDQWAPEQSRTATRKAIDDGLRFFITSHPSKCAVAVMDLFEGPQALAIVTASTTPELTGKDDFTFRIIADGDQEQKAIAEYVHRLPGTRLLVIQDEGNLPYTAPAFAAFSSALEAKGKWRITRYLANVSHFEIESLEQRVRDDHDALFILAGSYQTAIGNIAQLFHHHHPEAPIILTPWARSPAIMDIAGPALSRIVLPSQYASRHDDPALADYFDRFEARFGYAPHAMTIGVRQGFELLDQAFGQGCRTPEAVKAFLLSKPVHQTSLGTIAFDRYGDVSETFYFFTNLERELR